MSYLLHNRNETTRWGEALGTRLLPGDVIALVGDLGAGKTTLTQAIARGLGIVSPVTSPTFTLVQEYAGQIPMFHFDPYRLDNPEDIFDLGFDEYFERGGVVVVEWADKIASLLPPDHLTLSLVIVSDAENDISGEEDEPRRLTAEAQGARSEQLLAEMAAFWEARANET